MEDRAGFWRIRAAVTAVITLIILWVGHPVIAEYATDEIGKSELVCMGFFGCGPPSTGELMFIAAVLFAVLFLGLILHFKQPSPESQANLDRQRAFEGME